MKRMLEHKDGIISGVDVRDMIKVFPHIEDRFKQRKSYDEYYFDALEVDVTIEQIEQLSKMFYVKIDWASIVLS